MIRWFVNNPVAANLMMVFIVVLGVLSVRDRMVIEFFPSVSVDTIIVRVPYRGASPAETETSICIPIEEALFDLEGVKELRSTAMENIGRVTLEVEPGIKPRELLDEVKNRVMALNTLPEQTEAPIYSVYEPKTEVLSVIVSTNAQENDLKAIAERIRDDLLALDGISQAQLGGVRTPEIAIELSQAKLKEYGVGIQQVVQALRNASLDLPAGAIETASGEVLIRSLGQAYTRVEFEAIPVKAVGDAIVKVADLGKVTDGYEENPLFARFNGRRCAVIEVMRMGQQSALDISTQVKNYVDTHSESFGSGVKLQYWKDRGRVIRSRLQTLTNSAWQGGLLVLFLLALFLKPSLAIWVCLGIPISFMGGLMLMPSLGVSINIISLFGFILVLGIVVDDAIVTGENIFRHLRMGKTGYEAAIVGTKEVSVPVTFGVLTTAVAFLPLLMLEGARGDIFSQLTLVIIPVLLFSLVESKLILPSHLKHLKAKTKDTGFGAFQEKFVLGLESLSQRFYRPCLDLCLRNPLISMVIFAGSCSLVFAYFMSGRVGFMPFPRVPSETPKVSLTMPLGTPFDLTAKHIDHITEQVETLKERYRDPVSGTSAIKNTMSVYGSNGADRSGQSHLGMVQFELSPPEERSVDIGSTQLIREWRKLVGELPGAQSLNFRAEIGRPSDPINIQLSHRDFEQLRRGADQIKDYLRSLDGVADISDSLESGKQELRLELKPEASRLGVNSRSLANQVRNAFYGSEALRLQRGQDDIRVMVRFPKGERDSLQHLKNMDVLVPSGEWVPLQELATMRMERSYASIERFGRKRVINIKADIDRSKVDQGTLNNKLNLEIPAMIRRLNPRIGVDMEGEAKETRELGSSLQKGFLLAFCIIYILLAIPFKSYGQPFIVLMVLPFGLVGAILGHIITGTSASFPSIFGILALMGVVVNDSLVLVDYINRHRGSNDLNNAIGVAATARFRPILLTSLTTFLGLVPLLLEQSTQAQFLKPMAISLGFGILFATSITLVLTPLCYRIYEDILAFGAAIYKKICSP